MLDGEYDACRQSPPLCALIDADVLLPPRISTEAHFYCFIVYEYLNACYNIAMKRKIKIIDNVSGKVIEEETEIRNLDHFNTQLRERAHVFRPKKGKGSFRRFPKHKNKI